MPPLAVASNIVATKDREAGKDSFTTTVSFDRDIPQESEFRHEVDGYQVVVYHTVTTGGNKAVVIVPEYGPQVAIANLTSTHSSIVAVGLNATRDDTIGVVAYNSNGPGPASSNVLNVDERGGPLSIPSGISYPADIETAIGVVTTTVTFVRPSNETTLGVYGTVGYVLFSGFSDGTRVKELSRKSLAQLGGRPGWVVSKGFVLSAMAIGGGDTFIVAGYSNDFDAVPAFTATAPLKDAQGIGGAVATVVASAAGAGKKDGREMRE